VATGAIVERTPSVSELGVSRGAIHVGASAPAHPDITIAISTSASGDCRRASGDCSLVEFLINECIRFTHSRGAANGPVPPK